ncbi:MAG: DegV family protein [Actinobacteria bacterium]|nr:DegV family protein [Actinomycetota bacterium]
MVQIVTDSSCDLPKEFIEKIGITVVPLVVDIDGEIFHEGMDITPREFYDKMAKSINLPKTSQPSPALFAETFDTLSSTGSILCITVSSKLSGTYQAALIGRDLSGADVTVFDSLTGSLGLGLQVLKACRLAKAGKTVDEIIAELTTYREGMNTLVLLNTLENIVKGGRLSQFQGSLSRILDIRVLLHDVEGGVEPLEKIHGKKRAMEHLLARIYEYHPEPTGLEIGITHINNLADAETIEQVLLEKYTQPKVVISEMGSTMGTYAGDGGMIIAF